MHESDIQKEYQRLDLASNGGDAYRGRSRYIVQLWWLIQDTLFRWSPQFLYEWRNQLLRLFGMRIGQGTRIRPTVKITYPWKVSLGEHCRIGDDAVLYSLDNISVGNHCVISQKAYICTGTHDYLHKTFDLITSPVIIEDQVWIASDVFIAPGVRIGQGCVVGVRSTVLHDLPAGMICFGTPAKPVKERP